MLEEILANFNWIDLLMACIVIRAIVVGLKSNCVVELFRLAGILFANFIILHYYSRLGEILNKYAFIPAVAQGIFAYILLWLTVVLVFKLIGEGWTQLLRIEPHPNLNKWLGFVSSSVRGLLVCSLTFTLFIIAGNQYLEEVSRKSFTGFYLGEISPKIYKFSYDRVVSKFFPEEHLNANVFGSPGAGFEKPKGKKGGN
ncbi:MAG: CvpA family protein [Candidatus Omnitrophota bacterium]